MVQAQKTVAQKALLLWKSPREELAMQNTHDLFPGQGTDTCHWERLATSSTQDIPGHPEARLEWTVPGIHLCERWTVWPITVCFPLRVWGNWMYCFGPASSKQIRDMMKY